MERLDESTWFEIFRTGVWHGMDYNKEDLDKIVKNFEQGDPKVPLIIGHNNFWGGEEKPALGWVKALKRSGNRLLAKARNVAGELVEAVNNEVYPMRSVELWMDYRGRGLALGAIAFLGGSNPEVGGMADFKFSRSADSEIDYKIESADGTRVCFAYGSTEKMVAANGGQAVKINHQKGEGENMTKEEMEKLAREAAEAAITQFKASPEFTGLLAENEQLKTEVAETRAHAAAIAVKSDLDQCMAFSKRLLDEARITPAQHNAGLGAFLASLDNTQELQFAGDKKQTRRAFAMELLQAQPGHAELFTSIDQDAARKSEQYEISSEVRQFAAQHGLDERIVAEMFAAQRRNHASAADLEDSGIVGARFSLVTANTTTK